MLRKGRIGNQHPSLILERRNLITDNLDGVGHYRLDRAAKLFKRGPRIFGHTREVIVYVASRSSCILRLHCFFLGKCRPGWQPVLHYSSSLLIQAQHISRRVTESGSNLGSVTSYRLHDLSAVCNDRVDRRRDAIDHDVDQQADLDHRFPAEHPSATHFAHRIIKRNCAVAACPGIPTEDLFVEVGGSLNIARRHFQVTYLAVSKSRMLITFTHWCLFLSQRNDSAVLVSRLFVSEARASARARRPRCPP